MSTSGAIKAGRAYVELFADDSGLVRGLKSAEARVMAFSRSMGSIGTVMLGMGASIVGALVPSINAASNMEQTVSKFNATFGTQAEATRAWANDFAKNIRRSERETLKSLSTFQAFFKGLELGDEQAAGLSKRMHELAVDFAAFHNMSDDEAVGRFISALSGSVESLDQFGINLHVGALEGRVQDMFGVEFKDASELQKTLARLVEIGERMAGQGATGAAEREKDSYASTMKALYAAFDDLSVAIGNVLLPVIGDWVKLAVIGMEALKEFVLAHKGIIETVFKFGALLVGIGGVLATIGTIGTVAATVMSAIAALATPVGALTVALALLTAAVIGTAVALGMEDAQKEAEFKNMLPKDHGPQTKPKSGKEPAVLSPKEQLDKLLEELKGTLKGGDAVDLKKKFPNFDDLMKMEERYQAPSGTISQLSDRMYTEKRYDPALQYQKRMAELAAEQLKLTQEEIKILKSFEPGMAIAP